MLPIQFVHVPCPALSPLAARLWAGSRFFGPKKKFAAAPPSIKKPLPLMQPPFGPMVNSACGLKTMSGLKTCSRPVREGRKRKRTLNRFQTGRGAARCSPGRRLHHGGRVAPRARCGRAGQALRRRQMMPHISCRRSRLSCTGTCRRSPRRQRRM